MMPQIPDIPDIGNWRFEYKYRLYPQQYRQVRAAIRPFMRLDSYTSNAPHGRYLVRSLYFDSADMRAYQEKISGDCDRTKLRIRTYARNLQKKSVIRVEMKARKGISMEKHSSFISLADYQKFIQSNHWSETNDPLLIEFERFVHLKTLVPLVLVEYRREGFSARAQQGLRITFDHQVQSVKAKTLFPHSPIFRTHQRGVITFEIKCNKSQPNWLHELVKTQGLRIVANSKFAKSIEISRPEIIQSSWSY
jgi:hypothetical protein